MSESASNPSMIELVTKVLPGFLGSVVAAVYLQKPVSKTEGTISILAGFFTSVFLTPYVVSLVAPGNAHAMAGIGYGIGMATVVFLPQAMQRIRELIASATLADFLGLGGKKKE